MPIGIALFLRAVEVMLKSMERECEQARARESGDFEGPSSKQFHVVEIVMSDFMRDDKCHRLVCGTTLVESAAKVNVTPRCCVRGNLVKPGNLDYQSLSCFPAGLKPFLNSSDTVDCPRFILEMYCLMRLFVQPLAKQGTFFELKIVRHRCQFCASLASHSSTARKEAK